jgi:hypothetical protein
MICKQLENDLLSVSYAAGGDYNYLAQPVGSVSTFDKTGQISEDPYNINPDVVDYYLFWYLSDPQLYQEFLNLQNNGIPGSKYNRPFDIAGPKNAANKKVFETLLKERVNPAWYKDLGVLHQFFNSNDFPVMPRFLVPAKLLMIQNKFPQIKITFALTMRQGEHKGDDIIPYLVENGLSLPNHKENLILSRMNIPGFLSAVSGSAIRAQGLIPLIKGEVNANGLSAMSRNVAHFFRDHPEAIDRILRLDSGYNLPVPNNIDHFDFARDLAKSLDEHGLRDKTTVFDKTTRIDINGGFAEFNVLQKYTLDGHMLNTVSFQTWHIENPDSRATVKNILMAYLREHAVEGVITELANEQEFLDKAKQDNAMKGMDEEQPEAVAVKTNAAMAPGGIDFNANKLQLDLHKQGAGVGINFDPELIQRFRNGDFRGFVPVIINITPISNIAPMLGLTN